MSNYKLVGIQYGYSRNCEHCGRIIKNIVTLENTITGERMEVGTTCFGKVMNLNEKYDKALQTEIKKYKKVVENYNETLNYEEKYNDEITNNFEQHTKGTFIDGTYTQVQKDKEEIITDIVASHLRNIASLIEKTESLNKFSKTGLIELNDVIKFKKEYNEIKNKYGFCGNSYKI